MGTVTEGRASGDRASGRDFRLLLSGAVVLLILVLLGERIRLLQGLRVALGLAYILFAPGYCLTAVLVGRDSDPDGVERVGLSLGLSIAWLPVLALFLDALPWGLRLWPLVFGELASTGLFAAVALWRRTRLPADEAFAAAAGWRPRAWWRSLPRADRRNYQFIAAVLILTGLALAWTFLVPSPDEFMTEFYMLGSEGLAESFPREVAAGEAIGVTLGVRNLERGYHTYRVEIWAVDPWAEGRRELVARDGPYGLDKGQSREGSITWKMPWAGDDQAVALLLFDGDGTEPYRSLRLWLDVKE